MALLERRSNRQIVLYQSPLLSNVGVPHGFTTRLGGVSNGPFGSLNLGNPSGQAVQDSPQNLAANYVLVHEALGAANRQRCYVHQVHSDQVKIAATGEHFDVNCKADAVATDDSTRLASVRVADCVPILLSTTDGRVVAAVHAGWRGVVAGVVPRAIDAIHKLASSNSALVAAIGPGISFEHFEVGPEVVAEFKRVFGPAVGAFSRPAEVPGKAYINLQAAIRMQLQTAGVAGGNIDTTDRCTIRDVDEFFSHRRDNGLTGRMAALIGPR